MSCCRALVCQLVILLIPSLAKTRREATFQKTEQGNLRRGNEHTELRKLNEHDAKPEARVIGGSPSNLNAYPYFVLLMDERPDELVFKSGCAGTLITEGGGEWVLTSAHCLSNRTLIDYAFVGAFDPWNPTISNGGQSFDIIATQDAYVHNQWNNDTFSYDFALLKLEYASILPTVSLATYNLTLQDGDNLDVIGFGATAKNTSNEAFQCQEATVSYVPNQQCSRQYNRSIPTEMLCAYGGGTTGTCQGDSGGPILKRHPTTNQMVQVGITSWGRGCALVNFSGVYARVSIALTWVQSIICQHSSDEATKTSNWCNTDLTQPTTTSTVSALHTSTSSASLSPDKYDKDSLIPPPSVSTPPPKDTSSEDNRISIPDRSHLSLIYPETVPSPEKLLPAPDNPRFSDDHYKIIPFAPLIQP